MTRNLLQVIDELVVACPSAADRLLALRPDIEQQDLGLKPISKYRWARVATILNDACPKGHPEFEAACSIFVTK